MKRMTLRKAARSKPTLRERLRADRQRMLESYAAAAADPEFMRELEEVDRAFDVTVGDGLEPEDFDV